MLVLKMINWLKTYKYMKRSIVKIQKVIWKTNFEKTKGYEIDAKKTIDS